MDNGQLTMDNGRQGLEVLPIVSCFELNQLIKRFSRMKSLCLALAYVSYEY